MNLSIKLKIILTSTLAVILCLGISGFAQYKSSKAMDVYQFIATVNFPNLTAISGMEEASLLIQAASNVVIGAQSTAKDADEAGREIDDALKLFESHVKVYESLPFAEGEGELWQEFKEKFWKGYVASAQKIVSLSGTGKEADRLIRDQFAAAEWKKLVVARDDAFEKLKGFQAKEVKRNSESAHSQANTLAWLVPVLLGVAGILSVVLAVFLGAGIASLLMRVGHHIDSSSSHVASISAQIASTSEELSQASTEQAASLEETAASLEQITAMISKSTDNSLNASTTSLESQKKAEDGRLAVEQMLTSMNEISDSNDAILNQINESNRQMSEIVKVIQEIGVRTKVINEIVFQTKLLSFNASVEAARAGEHGKGFAVVAEEVGNLAQMSGNAAREITTMLDSSISKVENIVKQTQQRVESLIQVGKSKVDSGVLVAKQCSDVLNEIVQNVSKVSELSQEISSAAQEQAQGVSEINKAMSQLDTVTQQNAATSEEASSASQELSIQAEALKSSVVELMTVITGKAVSSPAPVGTRSNVVPIKTNASKGKVTGDLGKVSFKRASGGVSEVPDRNDDGFKDI